MSCVSNVICFISMFIVGVADVGPLCHVDGVLHHKAPQSEIQLIKAGAERKFKFYENLGDEYFEESDFLASLILYRNAVFLVENDIALSDALWKKISKAESAFASTESVDFSNLYKFSVNYQNHLKEMRAHVSSLIDKKMPIQAVQQYMHASFKALLAKLSADIVQEIGPLPKGFALLASGSMAHGTVTPFSDVEVFYLLGEDCTAADFAYAEKFSKLFATRLVLIGETPVYVLSHPALKGIKREDGPAPIGFMLDKPQLYPFKSHISTPNQFSRKLCDRTIDYGQDHHIEFEFISHTLILGDAHIRDEYASALHKAFDAKNDSFLSRFKQDLSRWKLQSKSVDHRLGVDIKQWYRQIQVILGDLRLQFCMSSTENLWEIISALEREGKLHPTLANKVSATLARVCELRTQSYLKTGNQSYGLAIDVDESEMREILSTIYMFHRQAELYANSSDGTAPLLQTEDFDRNLMLGTLELCLLNFEKGEQHFIAALGSKSITVKRQAAMELGKLYYHRQNLAPAILYFEMADRLATTPSGHAESLYALGRAYLCADNLGQAHSLLSQAVCMADQGSTHALLALCALELADLRLHEDKKIDIRRLEGYASQCEKLCGRNHHHLTDMYHSIALALIEVGNDAAAEKWMDKALTAETNCFGTTHPHSFWLFADYSQLKKRIAKPKPPCNAPACAFFYTRLELLQAAAGAPSERP